MSEIEGVLVGDKIQLKRSDEAKRPLVQRLNRIEGQVRGLRGMIEEDRYCLDEIQQITALTSALREVAVMIIGEHVIPILIDQNPCVHWRSPMDMMRQGWSMSLFQASQQ